MGVDGIIIFMGRVIKSSIKRIIAKLFQILGISSLLTAFGCGNSNRYIAMYGVEPVDMYGTPSNFFTLDGTVTDSNGEAIKGIKITAKGNHEDAPSEKFTSGYSNDEGHYSIRWNDYNRDDFSFIITAEDVDGEENGSFNDKTIIVDFSETKKDNEDTWTTKYRMTGKDITLDEKSDTENKEE